MSDAIKDDEEADAVMRGLAGFHPCPHCGEQLRRTSPTYDTTQIAMGARWYCSNNNCHGCCFTAQFEDMNCNDIEIVEGLFGPFDPDDN